MREKRALWAGDVAGDGPLPGVPEALGSNPVREGGGRRNLQRRPLLVTGAGLVLLGLCLGVPQASCRYRWGFFRGGWV